MYVDQTKSKWRKMHTRFWTGTYETNVCYYFPIRVTLAQNDVVCFTHECAILKEVEPRRKGGTVGRLCDLHNGQFEPEQWRPCVVLFSLTRARLLPNDPWVLYWTYGRAGFPCLGTKKKRLYNLLLINCRCTAYQFVRGSGVQANKDVYRIKSG